MNQYKVNCIDKAFPEGHNLRNIDIFVYGSSEMEAWSNIVNELVGTGIVAIAIAAVPKKKSIFSRLMAILKKAV